MTSATVTAAAQAARNGSPSPRVMLTGSEFILDTPAEIPIVWGEGGQVLWASGEPLYIVGPAGVGKTTLAQQLALRRHGISDQSLLGFPVAIDPRPVLYIAADRPSQAQRSFARMVTERDRTGLDFLKVWRGALPFGDLGSNPESFAEWLEELEVGTVVVDSLKDVALGLSEDTPGAAVNQALQRAVVAGIEVAVLHHQRKGSTENKKPRALDDVYGSTWLTAGAGSVLLLWGEAGDPIIEARHLKQPAEEFGPAKIIHDHESGQVALHEPTDLEQLVAASSADGGLTVRDAACSLFETSDPNRNQIEKARRKLFRLVERGCIHEEKGSTKERTRYLPIDPRKTA